MTTNETRAARNLRKATMLLGGLGALVVAAATQAAAEVSCPQWSTPVCRHWNLGPPASCTEWACAADKQSDPPRKAALGPINPVRPHPIVRPPIVTTGPVNIGTGAGTATIYAKQSFSASGGRGRR
jgi:hypothetical protein